MINANRNEITVLNAGLLNKDVPHQLLDLKSVDLVYDEKIIKTLQASPKANGEWETSVVLSKDAQPGIYKVNFHFDYDGEPLLKTCFMQLDPEVEPELKVKEEPVKEQPTALSEGIPVEAIMPTIQQPKFDQRYAAYTDETPLRLRTCQSCMHFIKGDGIIQTQCQIVEALPLRIVEKGGCRLQRDSYELEGFIPEEDPTLPPDILAIIREAVED